MELQEVQNEILRKIGRNVLLYQEMEKLVKFLVKFGDFSGLKSELEMKKNAAERFVEKKSLGQVVGPYLEKTYRGQDKEHNPPEELTEIHVSFRFRIETNSDDAELVKKKWANLIDERNDLVHHFLEGVEPNSIESWLAAGMKLDAQRDEIVAESDNLRGYVSFIQSSINGLATGAINIDYVGE